MEVKKILWPTDFSSIAEKALPHVKSLTERYRAEIHVLYVIEDIAHHDGWYGAFEEKRVQELMEHAGNTATKRLGQICEKYLDGCPLYIKHVAVGDPAQEILKLIAGGKGGHRRHGEPRRERQLPFRQRDRKGAEELAVPVTVIPVGPTPRTKAAHRRNAAVEPASGGATLIPISGADTVTFSAGCEALRTESLDAGSRLTDGVQPPDVCGKRRVGVKVFHLLLVLQFLVGHLEQHLPGFAGRVLVGQLGVETVRA